MNACDSRHNEVAYKLYLVYFSWQKNISGKYAIKGNLNYKKRCF